MPTDASHADRAEMLLEAPERFEELAEDYEDSVQFYEKTARKVPSIDDSFEALIEYHQIFINRGPTEYVYYQLNRNTARSIKNMLLGDSKSGEVYRIHTLADAQQRVTAYQDLGMDDSALSLNRVVKTTLEEIYYDDAHRGHAYSLLNTFLADTTDVDREVVEFVARARLVEKIQNITTADQRNLAFDAYLDQVPNPLPGEELSGEELRATAQQKEYDNSERFDYHEAALHQYGTLDALFEYLYARSRDVAERYRHRNREEPSAAELELGRRQLDILQEIDYDWEKERESYIRGYNHLLRAQENSGFSWHSEQEPEKDISSNFAKAAEEYIQAADAIEEWHSERNIKYVSKAFRHAANATDTWEAKRDLHDNAIVLLIAESQQREAGLDAIELSRARHEFWKEVAEAYLALENKDPDRAHNIARNAKDRLSDLPMYESPPYHLKRALLLAGGRLIEAEENYADAADHYASFNTPDDAVELRQTLAQIKAKVTADNPDKALELARSEFDDESLITTTLRVLADAEIESVRSHGTLPSELLRDDTAIEETLQLLITLYISTNELDSRLKNHLRIVFFDL